MLPEVSRSVVSDGPKGIFVFQALKADHGLIRVQLDEEQPYCFWQWKNHTLISIILCQGKIYCCQVSFLKGNRYPLSASRRRSSPAFSFLGTLQSSFPAPKTQSLDSRISLWTSKFPPLFYNRNLQWNMQFLQISDMLFPSGKLAMENGPVIYCD